MEGFQRRYRELKAMNAHVVGVSSDTWATQGAFAREIGAEFPLLSDWPSNRTIETFGVGRDQGPTAMRATFVFDAEGVLRTVIDDQGDMEAHPDGAFDAVKAIADAE